MSFKTLLTSAFGSQHKASEFGTVLASLMKTDNRKPPDRGVTGMLAAYNRSPWVRAVTAKISSVVGSTRWRIYAVRKTGTERGWVKVPRLQLSGVTSKDVRRKLVDVPDGLELIEIYDHPSLNLLNSPNTGFPGTVSRSVTQLYKELTGEAFWVLNFDSFGGRSIPVSFEIIPPNWIVGIPTPDKKYFTVDPQFGRATPLDIPMEMIIWFNNPNPADLYGRGSAHMRALGDEIDTDEFAAKHVRSWFYNSARPDLLIYGRDLSRTDTDVLESKWAQKLQGYLKAHRPFFLKAAVEVKDLSHKFNDMQMVDLRKWERDLIIHVRGVPPEIFGIIENSNRATIDAADYLFSKHVIVPELDNFRSYLQMYLLPWYDERLILGYESPVEDDKTQQLDAAQTAYWALTMNEWREKMGEDRVPYGDKHVFMLQHVAVSPEDLAAGSYNPQAALLAPGQEPDEDEEVVEVEEEEEEAKMLPSGKATEKNTRARNKQIGGIDTTHAAVQLGPQMIDDLTEAFHQLSGDLDYEAVIAALEVGSIAYAMWLIDQLNVSGALESAKQTLRQALLVISDMAAEQLAAALGTESFSLTSEAALDELRRFGAGMVTNVSDETMEGIRAVLVDSYASGRTPKEIAGQIRSMIGLTEADAKRAVKMYEELLASGVSFSDAVKRMDGWIEDKIKKRAETIAVNELIEAGNRGQELIWEEAVRLGYINPLKAEREWIVNTGACEECIPMAGARAKIGQPYENGVYTPNDIHVRCRCGEKLIITP